MKTKIALVTTYYGNVWKEIPQNMKFTDSLEKPLSKLGLFQDAQLFPKYSVVIARLPLGMPWWWWFSFLFYRFQDNPIFRKMLITVGGCTCFRENDWKFVMKTPNLLLYQPRKTLNHQVHDEQHIYRIAGVGGRSPSKLVTNTFVTSTYTHK